MKLTEEILETNLAVAIHYPGAITSIWFSEKLNVLEIEISVSKYFTPNKNQNYEVYA